MDLNHQKIELIELLLKVQNAALIEEMLTLVREGILNPDFELTEAQKAELDARIEKYSDGQGKTYTWEEVKSRLKAS